MVYELQIITAADKEAFVTDFSRKFSWLVSRLQLIGKIMFASWK